MADEKPAGKSYFKVAFGGFAGLCTGAVAMYSQAIFDKVVKPGKPVANFSASHVDGLTATFDVTAAGQSGWWDFGDGSQLEPFDADKPQVTHTYAKPGSYKVALSVRNFLNDENDRNITVEVGGTSGSGPNELPPSIKGWKVEAVGGTQAPATFHITGELENADEVVWKLGNAKTEHLTAQSGPIDKYFQINQPGTQQIVLTALSKTKKDPQVLVHTVDVQAQKGLVYTATLTVTDTHERVERSPKMRQGLPVPVRDKSGAATTSFSKIITAGVGATFVSVELDPATKAAVRKDSVRIEVAGDKRSATVSGQWALAGDALLREAGGSDVLSVPLLVTEEHVTQLSPLTNQFSGNLGNNQRIEIDVPNLRRGSGAKRTMAIDFGLLTPDGKRTTVASGTLDPAVGWTKQVKLGGKDWMLAARTVGSKVVITFQ